MSERVRTARLLLSGAGLVVSAVSSSMGYAETTKTFPVTAVIVNGCSVVTDGTGTWGTIDLGTTPGTKGATTQASLVTPGGAGVVLQCTPGVTATLAADNGSNAAAGTRNLKLTSGTARIPYLLYADGSATPWTTDTLALPFTAASGRRTVPVRAVATLAAMTPAGTYTDTVRITLTW